MSYDLKSLASKFLKSLFYFSPPRPHFGVDLMKVTTGLLAENLALRFKARLRVENDLLTIDDFSELLLPVSYFEP